MGVSILCTKPKYDFDMGYFGFFKLRKTIAACIDKDFGELYDGFCHGNVSEKEINTYFQKNEKKLIPYEDVLDFLFASDCEGKISYRTCGKISVLLLTNYEPLSLSEHQFRYGIKAHDDYMEFIEFLKDCYSHRKVVRWS